MTVESLPNFTATAAERWKAIPPEARKRIIANVWCGKCREGTTITNFSGSMKSGNLLLVGHCAVCHADVARVVEPA